MIPHVLIQRKHNFRADLRLKSAFQNSLIPKYLDTKGKDILLGLTGRIALRQGKPHSKNTAIDRQSH